ncbi:MAG: aminotransferase class I/II-fold pyridoxal phosphate-dependent enzyme [Clostridia bacterium]|nr:aminotransferase class I/II-fold pyridoxal phosphate-dependent enzyme [Clostridia bacterium]
MLINRSNPHGGDIYNNRVLYDFSSNLNPAGMPDAVKKAVAESAELSLRYPDAFCHELRKKISESEKIPYERIICGNGAAELIYSYAYSLSKNKPALIISPTFCEYENALRAAGIETKHLILSEDNGFCLTEELIPDDLSEYCSVFVCSPNNPTGMTVKNEILVKLCNLSTRVFADLCFLDLSDCPDIYDITELTEKYSGLTVLKAFTKNYSMAGIRLGYAMCSDGAFLEKMSEKTQCWNVSETAQQAGVAALDCVEWLNSSVKMIKEERKRVFEAVSSVGIKVFRGSANFLLLHSELDLKTLLLKKGILIRDCSNYIGLSKGYYRIAIRKKEENDILISALKEVVE